MNWFGIFKIGSDEEASEGAPLDYTASQVSELWGFEWTSQLGVCSGGKNRPKNKIVTIEDSSVVEGERGFF